MWQMCDEKQRVNYQTNSSTEYLENQHQSRVMQHLISQPLLKMLYVLSSSTVV